MSDEKKVAIRKLEIYQTDDARRIEVWEKASEVAHNPLSPEVDKNEDTTSFIEQEKIYVGLLQIFVPIPGEMGGPKEIRFKIENVANIEEAFEKYNDLAKQTADEVEQQIEAMIKEKHQQEGNKIITAPAEVLNQIGPNNLGAGV